MNNYPLFEHWYKACDWILDKCDRMPKHIRFTISGRIANLAIEILELITEAVYTRDRNPLIARINLNLEKLRIFFRLCHDRQYVNGTQLEFIQTEINKAGRMCGGWAKQGNPPL